MANPYKGDGAEIELNGKKYKLAFDWDALAQVQDAAGELQIAEIFTMKVKLLCQLLEIGLKKHHPEITAKDIMAASPTIYNCQQALSTAMELTYWGKEGPPKELVDAANTGDDKKKPTTSATPSS